MLPAFVTNIPRQTKQFLTIAVLRTYSSAEAPKFETLAVSVPKPYVYHVELNRPKKLNTFNNAMWGDIRNCFNWLSSEPECRVVILSGQGKHFTAGIDLSSFVEMGQKAGEFDDVARKSKFLCKKIEDYQTSISSLEKCVKPVLAVVHNACIGAGVDIITSADIRYCSADARFQVKEVDVGLAADVGTLQRLPKIVGNMSIVRELCYTARTLESKEALEIGLVGRIFPDKESALNGALEVAANIAAKSPVAVQTTKQNLVYSLNKTNDEGLEHIKLLNQTMLQSEDLMTAAVAQASKGGVPEFENL